MKNARDESKKFFRNINSNNMDIIKNIPVITWLGSTELVVENYKGIIEYTTQKIRLNTKCGVCKIQGDNMTVKHITAESLTVRGKILSVEYIV